MANLIMGEENDVLDPADIGETYLQEVNEFLEELNSSLIQQTDSLLNIWEDYMGDFDKEIALVPICEIC